MADNIITDQNQISEIFHNKGVIFSADAGVDLITQASNTIKQLLPLENLELKYKSLDWANQKLVSILDINDDFPWLDVKDEIEIRYDIVPAASTSGFYAKVADITGNIYVLGILFKLSIGNDYFGAVMSNPNSLTVNDLLKTFMGGEIDIPLHGLAVNYASFEYQGGESKSFTLEVAVTDSNKPSDSFPFQLDNIEFTVEVDDMKFYRAKLLATCSISSFTFIVIGEYKVDNGFTFKFKYAPATPVNELGVLKSLIQTISGNSDFDFPSEVPITNISVSNIDFSINSRTKEIGFSIDANCSFGDAVKITGSASKTDTTSIGFDVELTIDGSLDKSSGIPFTFKFELDTKIDNGASEIDQKIKISNEGYGLEMLYSADLTNVTVNDAIKLLLEPIGLLDHSVINFITDNNGIGGWNIKHFDLTKDPLLGNSLNLKIAPDFGLDILLTAIGIDGKNPIVAELGKYIISELSFRYSSSYGFSLRTTVTNGGRSYNFKVIKKDQFLIGNFYATDGGTISLTPANFPLNLEIKDLFLANFTPVGAEKSTTLFGSDLDVRGAVDLSTMEVVGHFFSEIKFSFDAVRFTYSSADIDSVTLTALNNVLQGINVSPVTIAQNNTQNNSAALLKFPQGISLQGNLTLGDNGFVIPLYSTIPGPTGAATSTTASTSPAKTAKTAKTTTTATTATPATTTAAAITNPTVTPGESEAKPTPIGKQIGPVHLASISLGLKGGDIHFTVSGGIQIGPIEVDLIGFSIESPIKKFDPTFGIDGIAIKFDKPTLTIDGEFAKITIPGPIAYNGASYTNITEYSGGLAIGINAISLIAIGSYAKIGDCTSVFFFGCLSMPIAIPPIGVIESMALGFGMNRDFTLPKPENIDQHALIIPLVSGTLPSFQEVDNDIKISIGENWFAIGVKVMVLDMLDALVLLVVKFGDELEFDILGRAELTLPKVKEGEPALCKLIVGVVATILPEQGVVAVNGAFLSGSYIYCPEVQISGGFAMLYISKDQTDGLWSGAEEGDFVMSLGGYSPFYTPKPYYPVVPRLALSWKPCDSLNITAQAYCTVTPDAFMVGGQIVADFSEGGDFAISVHFEVGADFIVWFKPYHYKGNAYATLIVKATIDVHMLFIHIHMGIELDMHADITFWGPSFAGHANVSVHFLVSFSASVSFGPAEAAPLPLSTAEFNKSFFSKENNVVSAKITDGLLPTQPLDSKGEKLKYKDGTDLTLVNAKDLVLEFTSGIPVKTLNGFDIKNSHVETVGNFGISAMGNTKSDVGSDFTLTITKEGNPAPEIAGNFKPEILYKNYPSGMWQPAADLAGGSIPSTDSSNPLLNLCSGIKLSAALKEPSDLVLIPSRSFDKISMPAYSWDGEYSY
jgi:hypothetical protein